MWGNSPKGAPAPQRGLAAPIFGPYVSCDQTAEWIKMPLGKEVGLGPGHSVLDGEQAPPERGTAAPSPLFGPRVLWPNGWMDQDATWYGASNC